jgi:D-aspartate ligase
VLTPRRKRSGPAGRGPLPTVVLVGLDSATGLQVARVLHRRGWRVAGIARDRRHWAARTRAAIEVLEVDHSSPAALLDTLSADPAPFEPGSILLPCTDPSVLAVATGADRLRGRYRFADPPTAAVEALLDKASFASVAARAGAPTATAVEVRTEAEIDDALAAVGAPCVIKPARKDARWLENAPDKAIRVADRTDLHRALMAALGWSDHLLVQEWVEGPDTDLVTCNCYVDPAGRVQASVVSSKLRQWPPHTGTGSAAVTVHDPRVAEVTARILASVGFTGLGYVEYKRRGDRLVAIEANVGRPTGRSVMAEAAGVELHHAFCADLAGLERPPLTDPAPGVVWVHLRRDVQAAVRQWRHGDSSPGAWLRSIRRPRRFAVADRRDPLPFLLDLATTLRKRLPVRTARDGDAASDLRTGEHLP